MKPHPHSTLGFTFLEILVALVIMSVVGVALLVAHSRALRAEEKARAFEECRLVMDRAVTEARLGRLPPGAVTAFGGWRVEAAAGGSNAWRELTISPTNDPESVRTILLPE